MIETEARKGGGGMEVGGKVEMEMREETGACGGEENHPLTSHWLL